MEQTTTPKFKVGDIVTPVEVIPTKVISDSDYCHGIDKFIIDTVVPKTKDMRDHRYIVSYLGHNGKKYTLAYANVSESQIQFADDVDHTESIPT